MVLSLLPLRSRHESLLLVFWLLIRPPAALSCEPKPPFPPTIRGTSLSETSGEEGSWRAESGELRWGRKPECEDRFKSWEHRTGCIEDRRVRSSDRVVLEGMVKKILLKGGKVSRRTVVEDMSVRVGGSAVSPAKKGLALSTSRTLSFLHKWALNIELCYFQEY
jgi:hypothetical protein